jgi:hypothetical protein
MDMLFPVQYSCKPSGFFRLPGHIQSHVRPMNTFPHGWRALSLLALALPAACATGVPEGPGIEAYWRVAGGTAVLRRATDGALAVEVPGTPIHIPLPGYVQATVDGVLDAQGNRVAIIRGSSPACPLSYTLVPISATASSSAQIRDCRSAYNFTTDGRIVVATEVGSANPAVWVLDGERLSGHGRATARRVARPPREQSASVGAPAQPPPGDGQPEPMPPAQEAVPQPVPEAAPIVDAPPRRLVRVGDDIVPSALAPPKAPDPLPTIKISD